MKYNNFFKNQRTNWKYVFIVLILASILGGGILGYQWWWQRGLEIQNPGIKITERPIVKQKVSLITDKTEYKRDDIIKYTIINNSSSVIFPILSEETRLIELQKYNYNNKKWEPSKDYELMNKLLVGYDGYFPVFSVSSKNPVGPISILGKEENNLSLNEVLSQFNDEVKIYRIVFLYYESNPCYENSFWGNPECSGKTQSKSWLNPGWEEIKTVTSNEFTVKGTILAEVAVARSFCLEKYKESGFYLELVRFLNFDGDGNKEIIGLCWKGEYDKQGLLFVLDNQNNQWKSAWEKEGETHQRYYTFENLKINDVNGDGIDEIIYEENGWYMAGGDSYLHLYSPKYQEWFYRDNWWDEATGTRKEGIKFSSNLDLEKYKTFKEFFLKQ